MSWLARLLFAALSLAQNPAPPPNFYQVDGNLYRGAQLTEAQDKWLAAFGVRTILKLNEENPEEAAWGVPVHAFPINGIGLNLSYDLVKRILSDLEFSRRSGKVYVHCEHGADRTGLIIALYRVAHGWSKEAAWKEMYDPRFGHDPRQVWMDNRFRVYANRIAAESATGSSRLF